MASVAGSSISVSMQAPSRQLAMTSISGLKLVSFSSQGRSNLSFNLRPIPARLRISCAAKQETLETVCKLVKKQLSLPEDQSVTAATKFSELGADSLDTVEIVMALEEEFSITMAEESAQKITTVEEAAELIDELVQEKGP